MISIIRSALIIGLFASICFTATAQEPVSASTEGEHEVTTPVAPAEETVSEPSPEKITVPELKKRKQKKEAKQDEDDSNLKISARIHVGWTMQHEDSTSNDSNDNNELSNEFDVKRARLKLRWEPNRWLMGVLQMDVSEAFETGGSILRDAYIHLSPLRQLEFRVGQFKKPFSGLELRSPAKGRIINRGAGNNLLVEDLRYGDRDIGLQLSGRLIKSVKLDYAISVFNGNGMNNADWEDNQKDLVGRLRINPHKRLQIGANGSLKFFENPTGNQPSRAWAAGGDIRFKIKGVRLYAEALVGENWQTGINYDGVDADDPPMIINTLAVLSYKHEFPISWKFAVEPAFKFEFMDPDDIIVDDEVMMYTLGLNTYFGEYFRMMINGEITVSSRNSASDYPDTEALLVLACLDI